jgi:tol-pal system protein YbgF
MRRALLLPLVALLLAGAPAFAQQTDPRALADRLDRLQRDVDTLQRQVYRGAVPPGSAPPGTAFSGGGTSPPPMSGGEGMSTAAIARFDARISQMEITLREVTGKVEEMTYANEQTRQQLDKLSSDLDVRFQMLEQKAVAAPPAAASAPAAPPAATAAAAPARPPAQSTAAPGPASASGNLGSLSERQLQANAPAAGTPPAAPAKPAPPPQQQAARAPAAAILPDGSPEDQYKFAFNILLQNDYDQAERAFRAFIDKHPNDSRSENARYWLAETFYVRDKFEQASTAFAEAYQKSPNGAKAPDNLLKLGMSLAKTNKQPQACAAFVRLGEQFPNAPGTVKTRAQTEKQRIGCK